ncbi:hypothetical protein [Jiangella anatolica]|uniref:hypothetical protein n=1 Tax=Jiangella anatolica TaxID=2670374 RepID=UPI0011B4F634|nr:hypothetical protein [Jiangella anatolica]
MEWDWNAVDWTAVGGISAAATALVAIGALLAASRDSRERTRPVIVVEYRVPPFAFNRLDLVVRNVGASTARNIRVTFDPPLSDMGRDGILARSVIHRYAQPITVLGPGQELTNSVQVDENDPSDCDVPDDMVVRVEYDRRWRRNYKDTFRLQTSAYFDHTSTRSSDAPEGRLKEIGDQLKKLTAIMEALHNEQRRDDGDAR